jgi:Protein of unknown function (DUF4199)
MKIALKYGLIYSGINILWTLLMFITELNRSDYAWVFNLIAVVIPVICIIMAIKEFKAGPGAGFMSFGQAFKHGMVICLVGGIIFGAFNVVYLQYIDTNFMEFQMQKQVDKMAEMGMSEGDIEKALARGADFQTPFWMFTMAIVVSLIFGLILSLIMAAILKKENPDASPFDAAA